MPTAKTIATIVAVVVVLLVLNEIAGRRGMSPIARISDAFNPATAPTTGA